MRPRNPLLLQELPAQLPEILHPPPLGERRADEDRATGQGRGYAIDVTSAGDQFGVGGGGYC